MRLTLVTLLLSIALGCGGAPTGPSDVDPPPASSLPAPYTDLRIPLEGATYEVDKDGDLIIAYHKDESYKEVLAGFARGLEKMGYEHTRTQPIPNAMMMSWSKDGRTISALAGGSKGKVEVVVEVK